MLQFLTYQWYDGTFKMYLYSSVNKGGQKHYYKIFHLILTVIPESCWPHIEMSAKHPFKKFYCKVIILFNADTFAPFLPVLSVSAFESLLPFTTNIKTQPSISFPTFYVYLTPPVDEPFYG